MTSAVRNATGTGRCIATLVLLALSALGTCLGVNPVSPDDESGLEPLRQSERVVIQTNRMPASSSAKRKEKAFRWNVHCNGWNGLYVGFSKQTLLGWLAPGVTNREGYLEELSHSSNRWAGAVLGTNVASLTLEKQQMNMKIGGRLAVDAAGYVTGQQFQDFEPGLEVRRARVYAKGDCLILLPVSYELEIGYVPNQFYIEKSYIALRDLALIGDLRVGQYQPPMGLDVITSSRDITFMEPSSALQALAPGTSAGAQIGRTIFNERASWRLGAFTEGVGTDYGDASKDYGRAIGRVTWLAVDHKKANENDSDRYLHLGLSANFLYSSSSTIQYRSRPESHLAPYVIDTGDISAHGAVTLGSEAAWVNGPFSVQGEYLHSFVERTEGDRLNFTGLYGSVSWFLTGEIRRYDRIEAEFGRVVPQRNFDWGHGGWGAVELAGRYSFVNLNSGDVQGGRLSMLMAGVNWYPHSHIRWKFDYGFGHVSERSPRGNINVFQTRMEVDF